MTASTHSSAGALALPIAITALLAALALVPGCILVANDGDGGGRDCVNPFDDNCFNCMDGCGEVTDTDGDRINDEDEAACNLDADNADTDLDGTLDCDEDLDGDGFNTSEELDFGSDCANGDDSPDGPPSEGEGEDLPPDADDDGLSDGEEAARGTDPNNADSDGDGQCDKAEVDCNSSPLDPFFTCT